MARLTTDFMHLTFKGISTTDLTKALEVLRTVEKNIDSELTDLVSVDELLEAIPIELEKRSKDKGKTG